MTAYPSLKLSDFDAGFMVGLLTWIAERFRFGELYGPYKYDGRRFYQWMARGTYLREVMVPFLDQYLLPIHSERVYRRYEDMKERYASRLLHDE